MKCNLIMEMLNMDTKPHDTRHTFATLMELTMLKLILQLLRIIGHIYTTTQKIYTHKDIEELRKDIEMI